MELEGIYIPGLVIGFSTIASLPLLLFPDSSILTYDIFEYCRRYRVIVKSGSKRIVAMQKMSSVI